MQILYIYEITKVGVLNGVKYLHSDLLNNEIESFLFSNKEMDQKKYYLLG